ncbi:mitochondrial assembly of ribosomal large subunit protein 1 [Nelusetta ayraudi]|uniref:mitochondrial assembly of ribosomal large subunit protein 1 n=1 Tax=Nelusetta ayraudi TaxID=303726 RepID=UPI003F6FCDAA
MFHVLKRCQRLLSPVFTGTVSPALTRLEPRASRHSPTWRRSFALNVSPCQRRWRANSSHPVTTRRFSEERRESGDQDGDAAAVQGETMDIDRRSESQGSSARFSLDVLVSLLRQENAVDICVIKVPQQIKYTDYFIVVSGISTRHLRAMALYAIKVYKFLKTEGEPHARIEGKDTEDWMCIDFGNMVVHFMLPETREIYELEKLWTLRSFDEQLKNIPSDILPDDFIYDDADVPK